MQYVSPIDPHVHLRGEEYTKDWENLAFRDAAAVGLCHMLEMPNCKPFLTSTEACERRVRKLGYSTTRHGINIGLTTDLGQVHQALLLVMNRQIRVAADKIFYTHSTGNMGICDPKDQEAIWKLKGEMGYNGVSMGHFEDETLWKEPFDPKRPFTHSERQNEASELNQVMRQLRWAYDYNFQGTFYICHVSSPDTVDMVVQQRHLFSFRIVLEATWHHIFLNYEDYFVHGNRVKMNPPLRERAQQKKLLAAVHQGKIDVIGSDHAPHPLERKDDPENPASGIPALPFWPKGIELLRDGGIMDRLLEAITYRNANIIFRLGLPRQLVDKEYNPVLWEAYGFNPFARVDGTSSS